MPIVPDITEITLDQSPPDMSHIAPALKDVFDPSITSVANVTNVSSINTNHGNGPDAQRFDLVANTNSSTAFAVSPTASGESWHLNFRQTSAELIQNLIDPNADITDSTTTPPTVGTSGEESPENGGYAIRSGATINNVMYLVEFDDAMWILNSTGNEIKGAGYLGKTVTPLLGIGQGFGYHASNADSLTLSGTGIFENESGMGQVQQRVGDWAPPDSLKGVSLQNNWFSGNLMVQAVDVGVTQLPNSNFRDTYLVNKYSLLANQSETPGTMIDGGASSTDWVYFGEDGSTIVNEVIPWDTSITPDFA